MSLYKLFTAIKIEQFLPLENKIPDGVISNGLGDPKERLDLDWAIDTVKGRKTISNKDWIAYNADGEKLMIESHTMREFPSIEFYYEEVRTLEDLTCE